MALALERSRAPERVDGVLRRALEGDDRAARRLHGPAAPPVPPDRGADDDAA